MVQAKAPQKTIQAVIVLEGSTLEQVSSEMVMAGMTVLHQYNRESKNYVGDYEAKQFKEHFDSWVTPENSLKQELFFASRELMNEIEYNSALESIPLNNYNEETSNVLVLGPFTESRIHFFTEGLRKA